MSLCSLLYTLNTSLVVTDADESIVLPQEQFIWMTMNFGAMCATHCATIFLARLNFRRLRGHRYVVARQRLPFVMLETCSVVAAITPLPLSFLLPCALVFIVTMSNIRYQFFVRLVDAAFGRKRAKRHSILPAVIPQVMLQQWARQLQMPTLRLGNSGRHVRNTKIT